jgi:hypothetical protein
LRLGPSLAGRSLSSSAAAPSDSIQRRKSFSNASTGLPSSSASERASSSKFLASIRLESFSDPVTTALRVLPERAER